MRKSVTYIAFLFSCFSLTAQQNPLVEINVDFSSIDTLIVIDPTLDNNQWEIGHPNKSYFDSAYSSPDAICTRLDDNYLPNSTSVFQLTIVSERFGSGLLEFVHKYDTEQGISGAYIEISYDQGISWDNLVNESNWRANFYEDNDIIFNGEAAFTGFSDGWMEVEFSFLWYALTKHSSNWPDGWGLGHDGDSDTLLLRFNFICNSEAIGKPGWMIDDISFKVFDISGNIQNLSKADFSISYNPVDRKLLVKRIYEIYEDYSVFIFDVLGRKKLIDKTSPREIDVGILQDGIYFLVVEQDGYCSHAEKILIH